MEKYEFKLIQEMADVQEYLDDIMYREHGKNVPNRITNNELILIKSVNYFRQCVDVNAMNLMTTIKIG